MSTFISAEKLEEIKAEWETRKTITRREIAERIAAAKELGDLSENFEYHEAKDAQGMNEARISQIRQMLSEAVVVEQKTGAQSISLGCSFTVKLGDLEKKFELVGASEASPLQGKISNESPLGNAFLGKKVGDKVEVEVPSGAVVYEILRIE